MAFDKWDALRAHLEVVNDMATLEVMNELDAEEARLKPPAPTLKPGDKMRYKTNGWLGKIDKIAASGLRARVQWDQKYYPASYIEFRNLELVEEAPQ